MPFSSVAATTRGTEGDELKSGVFKETVGARRSSATGDWPKPILPTASFAQTRTRYPPSLLGSDATIGGCEAQRGSSRAGEGAGSAVGSGTDSTRYAVTPLSSAAETENWTTVALLKGGTPARDTCGGLLSIRI